MIHIAFEPPETLVWKRWCSDCQKAAATLADAVINGQKAEVSGIYKRKSIKDEVFFAKEGPFHGKCAYCECYLADFQRGDVEHFRPKNAITDEEDNIAIVEDENGNTTPHRGYYWLAYDWTNLLPSCAICNQPTAIDGQKIGKHNRFPVGAGHATSPSDIANEKPLLINPTQEDPEMHLSVDANTGLMNELTSRGKMCIRIFGLNVRDRLVEDRMKAINDVKAQIDIILHNPDSAAKKRAMDELREIKEGKRSYAAAGRAALNLIRPFLSQVLEG